MRARPSLRANGSRECAPERHCEQSEAIQSRKKGWIASSLTLLAMTGPGTGARSFETVIASQWVARMRARPSLRAKRSNPSRRTKKGWIASSLTLLAMTGRTPAQGVLRPSLRANGSRECAPDRHCERSEAIQSRKKEWIASSLTLLAMTGPGTGARSFETVIASQRVARMRARPSLRAKRSNPSRRTKKSWIASSLTLLAMTGPDTGARSFETVIASQWVARMRARASLRAKRSNPEPQERLDCFVADAPRNDGTDTGARSFETVSQRVARMRA